MKQYFIEVNYTQSGLCAMERDLLDQAKPFNNCTITEAQVDDLVAYFESVRQAFHKAKPRLKMFSEVCPKKVQGHSAIVYTLVNYDTTLEQDLERIYTLRDMGYWAYVMIYDKEHCKPVYRKLARWVNNRFVFAKCERFEHYLK